MRLSVRSGMAGLLSLLIERHNFLPARCSDACISNSGPNRAFTFQKIEQRYYHKLLITVQVPSFKSEYRRMWLWPIQPSAGMHPLLVYQPASKWRQISSRLGYPVLQCTDSQDIRMSMEGVSQKFSRAKWRWNVHSADEDVHHSDMLTSRQAPSLRLPFSSPQSSNHPKYSPSSSSSF